MPFKAVTSITTEDYEFEYVISAQVTQFPALAARMAAECDEKLNGLKKSEIGSAKPAKAEGPGRTAKAPWTSRCRSPQRWRRR
ncbi:hypothetical protein [uncultured Sphingomonas sp.]|uniref:hypothetical protein n=1 Tax=uncultured Sphingomonas sp. TaxID=158754 RepID=UPI0025D61F7A|nr:hypothetical protein [uncultured Sphingomonas sp.]